MNSNNSYILKERFLGTNDHSFTVLSSEWGGRKGMKNRQFIDDWFVLYITSYCFIHGLPWWLRQQRICLQCRRYKIDPWVRKIRWKTEWLSTPVFLPRESHGQRSLVDYSPWGHKELGMTEWLTLNTCIVSGCFRYAYFTFRHILF